MSYKQSKSNQGRGKSLVHYSIYSIIAFIIVSSILSFWNRYVTYDTRDIIRQTQFSKALIHSVEHDVINEITGAVHTYMNTGDSSSLIIFQKVLLTKDTIFRVIASELTQLEVNVDGLDRLKAAIAKHAALGNKFIQNYADSSIRGQLSDFKFNDIKLYTDFKLIAFQQLNEIEVQAESDYDWSIVDNAIIQIILIVLSIPILIVATTKLHKEVRTNESLLTQLDKNNRELLFNDGTVTEINANEIVGKSINSLKLAFNFVDSVSNGDYAKAQLLVPETKREINKKTLIGALVNMAFKLHQSDEDEKRRQWSSTGLNQFFEIVRNNQHELKSLADIALSFLTKYLQSQQASLFVLEGNGPDAHLNLVACFAFDKKKYVDKRIEIGSGMVGQAFLEMQPIHMTDIPRGYTSITSGLGDATPTNLLIVPFMYNQKVEAILEVAGFNFFEPHHIEFLKKAGEFLASTLQTLNTRAQMELLLGQSQAQTEMMRAQEEELRQNMEELEATNEAIRRSEMKPLVHS